MKESKALGACVQFVFKLLGWRFASSGTKAPEFGQCLQALGIVADISSLHLGLVLFDNTQSRKDELVAALEAIISTKRLSKAEALKLRGRLQFSASQIFGRVAKAALAIITNHAYHSTADAISDEMVFTLTLRKKFLLAGEPRKIKGVTSNVYYIYTDA